jgi:two-component system CheB/CheR fusion protein
MSAEKDSPVSEPEDLEATQSPEQEIAEPATAEDEVPEPVVIEEEASVPVVGIGASAGGLDAFRKFFVNMPPDSGMAFVLVQHLSSPHTSLLDDLVRRYTQMEVYLVIDGIKVQPNCTYVIPPDKDLALLNGRLYLMEPEAERGLRLPINYFFRSLAQDQGERAICIVLSGTGSDGTLGVKAVKEVGGMTMAQDVSTTQYDGMPRSAVATGLVDFVLPPEEMPEQLLAYISHTLSAEVEPVTLEPTTTESLQQVFVLLRSQTGYDFSYYKQNTIRRSIERRMAINQLERLDDYIRYLQQNTAEVEVLFHELLIGVTNFFRDPEAFKVLETQVIPPLFEDRSVDQPVRVWVPGCATGEEAYSIAILLRERISMLQRDYKVQIFATDIDSESIEKARAGIFSSGIVADISPERLKRFFIYDEEAEVYRIRKSIRDMVVFAEQNLAEDPPFSRMDLISCRNLLIYLQPTLQKRVLPVFHYALKPEGVLLLGNSESVGELVDLFAVLDRKWKLYRRKEGATAYRPSMVSHRPRLAGDITITSGKKGEAIVPPISMRELVEKELLQHHTPACAIINKRAEVLYIHGRTGKYLEPASGEASLNLLRMAREGLRLELTTAIRQVALRKVPVQHTGVVVRTNGSHQSINLTVKPVLEPPAMEGLILVLFEEVPTLESEDIDETVGKPGSQAEQRIAALERELRAKEEYLQSTVEELETSNEELKSANEELQSANEEHQSTNEELETSREELQSVNEELVTVNAEYQQKIEELSQTNNDMDNLLTGTGVGTVFVDFHLRIKRFTPAASQVINLIQSDIGRPVSHIASNLVGYDNLVQDVQSVLNTLVPVEIQVQSTAGEWYLMRIMPYRTLENVVEGAVITFVDITELTMLREESEGLRRLAVVVRDSNDAITVQDIKGQILAWNPGAVRIYGWSETEALAMNIQNTVPEAEQQTALTFMKELISGEIIAPFEAHRVTKGGTVLTVLLTGTVLVNEAGVAYAIATTERVVGIPE